MSVPERKCDGRLLKLPAAGRHLLCEVQVPPPNRCIPCNTVTVDDRHGRYVATRWYGRPDCDSAIRAYNGDVKLVCERAGLPNGKKDTLSYFDGKLVCGSGDGWNNRYTGTALRYIAAYSIADGQEEGAATYCRPITKRSRTGPISTATFTVRPAARLPKRPSAFASRRQRAGLLNFTITAG